MGFVGGPDIYFHGGHILFTVTNLPDNLSVFFVNINFERTVICSYASFNAKNMVCLNFHGTDWVRAHGRG